MFSFLKSKKTIDNTPRLYLEASQRLALISILETFRDDTRRKFKKGSNNDYADSLTLECFLNSLKGKR